MASRTMSFHGLCNISSAKIQTSLAIVVGKYTSSTEIQLGIAKIPEGNSGDKEGNEAIAQIEVCPVTIGINESETVFKTLRRVYGQVEEAKPSANSSINYDNNKRVATTGDNLDAVFNEHSSAVAFAQNTEAKIGSSGDKTTLFSGLEMHVFQEDSEMQVLLRCSPTSAFAGILKTVLDVWQHVLEQVCEDNNQRSVSQMDFLPPSHMETLLHWNSETPVCVEKTVHELIKARTVLQPDAAAICSWDDNLTYEQLDNLSTSLAHHLAGLNIGPQTFVALCFDKSVWPSVCMLAILKAGGAFVPVDSKHPVSRKTKILEAAGASVVLTSPQYAHLFDGMDIAVVPIDKELVQGLAAGEHTTPLPSVNPADPMLIVNTSGSTGYPKSIIIQHSGVASSLPGLSEQGSITSDSRVLQFSAYSFDGYIHETFTTLTRGGCICVPSEDERVNDLSGAIVRMGVNTLNLTPSVARLLNPQDMPCVKNLSVGGETITNELLESWASHVVFTNVYGPAECIVACTYKKSLRIDDELNNIGKPLGSVLWVVDPKDHDILYPIGCVGELVIGGPGLAKCYTDRDLTNKSFIESPLWASNFRDIGQYTRFYKTGDLVKYKSDGDLVYIGRKDMQIKPGQGDRNKSNSENLRHPLKTLASYMVPQTWLAVDPLPLSAIGKLDRLRVKQLLLQEDVFVNYNVSQDQYGDSSTLLTDTEKSLQSLWSDVLNLPTESIDANSNFLELGGNSLKAMRLVALARRKKMRISLASIFQGPVLAAMATCVDAVRTRVKNKRVVSHAEDDAVQTMQHFELVGGEVAARDMFTAESHLLQHDLVWVDVYDMYPCTPLQAGLIALSAKYSGAHTLHNVWELSQSIDVSRFKAAWKACVRDNAILRTMIIPSADFGPCQVILKPESSRRSNLWQRKGKSISLDDYFKRDLSDAISCGSLLNRFGFAQDGKYFVWTCHHSGYDAVSMVLIIQAVERRYHEESSRTQRTQAVAPSIANLIRHIHTSDPQASQEWWQSYLRGATPAKFPQILAAHDPYADARMRTQASISRPSVNSNRSGIVSATIVRAAWALVLGRYSDTLDIVFGVTLGGRTADVVDIDSIVGPTATTLPVRVKIDPQETDRAYLERVQAKSTAMIAFEHVGIPKIAVIGPEYRAVCDLNSLLVIQAPGTNAIVELLGMPRLDLNNDNTTQATRSDVPSYALSIDAELGDSMANITITHDSQLISGPQISRMAGQFVHVIEQLSAGSASTAGELSVGDVDLVTEQDLAQLAIWNKTMPPARDTTVTADMAQWVEHDAMAPAVCAWDAELNYGELDKAADRMARLLTDMGIGANTVVPVCFDKSAWVVVAVLGILRAGSAYVALDPSHPQNRLEGIIADVDASVIVAAPQHAARFSMLPDIRVVAYTEAFVASLIGEYTDIDTSFSHLTPSPPSPASPAFILFSSGTAGRPKGIVVEHNAVCTSTNAFGSA
ncbi:hypothetical protein ACHAQD_009952 [Fusarium lateritium]